MITESVVVESIIQRLMDLKPILRVAFSPHEREDAHEVAGVRHHGQPKTCAVHRRVQWVSPLL